MMFLQNEIDDARVFVILLILSNYPRLQAEEGMRRMEVLMTKIEYVNRIVVFLKCETCWLIVFNRPKTLLCLRFDIFKVKYHAPS